MAGCTYTPTSVNPTDGISATYSGDDSYQDSSSPSALSQEVDQDGTSTALVTCRRDRRSWASPSP